MGRIKPLYKIHTDGGLDAVERALDSFEKSVGSIIPVEIINGNLLQSIALTTDISRIPHKLDRKLLGYIIVRQNANAVIYDQQDAETNPEIYLALKASAPVTISVWVF